jgi:hypothetical protein
VQSKISVSLTIICIVIVIIIGDGNGIRVIGMKAQRTDAAASQSSIVDWPSFSFESRTLSNARNQYTVKW